VRCLWDTDILSSYLDRRTPSIIARGNAYLRRYGRITLSAVTRYEILRGLKAKQARVQLFKFAAVCRQNRVLTLTRSILDLAADVWAALKRAGQLIGDNDIFIAATALHHGLTLATGNVAHFSRIPGLALDDWTQP
jgi:tRNA(fMet)-specific endonuclease VapC